MSCTDCGGSPINNPCPFYPNASCVIYDGDNLSCIGAITNERLDTILQKINDKLCTTPSLYTFTNAIHQETGQIVKWGGQLVEDTTIESNGYNVTFSTTLGDTLQVVDSGDVILTQLPNSDAQTVLTTNSSGVIQLISLTDIPPLYTFTNGLSEAGFTVKLGGPLIQDTNIDFQSFNFSLSNVPSSTPVSVLGLDGDGNIVTGQNVLSSPEVVSVATTAPLAASTYNNGTGGVGATITANSNGAIGSIDSVAVTDVGTKILVKDQSSQLQNGVYEVTQVGDGSNPFILTRTVSADETDELYPEGVTVTSGTINSNLLFLQQTTAPIVGTDPIVYAFSFPIGQQRFGIEDNTGVQNRLNNLGTFNLDIVAGTSDFSGQTTEFYIDSNTAQLFSQSSANVFGQAVIQAGGVGLTATNDGGTTTGTVDVTPNNVTIGATNGVTPAVLKLASTGATLSYAGSSDQYIPLTVNGNAADSTGEITLINLPWKAPLSCAFSSTGGAQQLGAGLTGFTQFTGSNLGYTLEANREYVISEDCTIQRLFIHTTGTQPGTGSMVCTIRKNFINTALVVTIAAGSSTTDYSNTSDIISLSAGDVITMQWVNNASSSSLNILSTGVTLVST